MKSTKIKFVRALTWAVLSIGTLALPIPSSAAVAIGISVGIAPPPLPIYEQPRIPAPGYIWTPGYWAWSPDGYYWVPGTWVLPPAIGLLWTPPWWGWNDGLYVWHAGYWGPHIGFYGGINYGFGYFGVGYAGGYWERGQFFYNRTVNNITNVNITNVYNRTVVNNVTVNRVSFNGGSGGITAQPTNQEQAAMRESHVRPTPLQVQHFNSARSNPGLFASANHGQPKVTATSFAGRFNNAGAVAETPRFQNAAGARRAPEERPPGRRGPSQAVNEAGRRGRPSEGDGRPNERNERP